MHWHSFVNVLWSINLIKKRKKFPALYQDAGNFYLFGNAEEILMHHFQ